MTKAYGIRRVNAFYPFRLKIRSKQINTSQQKNYYVTIPRDCFKLCNWLQLFYLMNIFQHVWLAWNSCSVLQFLFFACKNCTCNHSFIRKMSSLVCRPVPRVGFEHATSRSSVSENQRWPHSALEHSCTREPPNQNGLRHCESENCAKVSDLVWLTPNSNKLLINFTIWCHLFFLFFK